MPNKKSKLKAKSARGKKLAKGKGEHQCRICGSARGLISAYGLNICRRCFHDCAPSMGFSKY